MSGPEKLNRVVELLDQRVLDGLIIYSSGPTMGPKYLHYFSEVKPLGTHNAAVVTKAGDVTLLVEPQWDTLRVSEKGWIKNIIGSSNFLKDLDDVLRKSKITGSIGIVDSTAIPADVYSVIADKAKVEVADDLIEKVAFERVSEEIELARKTARIADIGFKACLANARVGIREWELLAEIEYAMRAAGADDCFNLIGSGKHNHSGHAATDRKLREGDTLIFEISAICGLYIQLCRTIVLGEPSNIVLEKYALLVQALEESFKEIKPGVPAGLIAKAQNTVLRAAGYGEYCRPPYMAKRGHFTNMVYHAKDRNLTENVKTILTSGQAVIVHPNQYLPETGYLMCGETILVTDTGFERLSETEAKVYVKEV
ncbi:MAG: M24 family metallopeptidase [Desulfobacterales bacterium]|nr:M24 family metallopeptidase [Desulfobacterales bacterium]